MDALWGPLQTEETEKTEGSYLCSLLFKQSLGGRQAAGRHIRSRTAEVISSLVLDTGFSGTLVVGEELFNPSQATPSGTVEAALAADQTWTFQCYDVQFDWFGQRILARILVGPGKDCLLGIELLNPHRLAIDYGDRTVQLDRNQDW